MYPHLALGAISSSGPLYAKEDFNEYDQAVSDALESTCKANIQEAMDDIQSFINTTEETEAFEYLQTMTGCTNITWDSRVDIAAGLADAVAHAIQYNTESSPMKTYMCEKMSNTSICATRRIFI